MKDLKLALLRGLKQMAVEKQNYEMAAALRVMEKEIITKGDKDDEDLEKFSERIKPYQDKLNSKIESLIGETYKLDADLLKAVTENMQEADKLEFQAKRILITASDIRTASWETIRKQMPEALKGSKHTINFESGIVTVIKD